MPRNQSPTPLSSNRVVHETPWVCWDPWGGGCGADYGMNYHGGSCPGCGHPVIRMICVQPAAPEATKT